jgi:hypothetical protein
VAESAAASFVHYGLSPLCRISLGECADALLSQGARPNGNQAELESYEDALTGGWGRTGEELRMPVTNDCAGFENRGRRFDLDHDDHDSRYHNGRGCVHDNAQRAMVCVTLDGMDVRHLDYGQQRKQDKTHDGDGQPGTRPGVKASAEISLESCQGTTFYLKNTHNLMRRECSWLRLNPEFKEAARANAG